MDLKMKYELAKEVSEYWKVNCIDDEFYDKCISNIMEELGDELSTDKNGCVSDLVYEIWKIIEDEFI